MAARSGHSWHERRASECESLVFPAMWAWMIGGRKGDAPEGGILVKEQYGDQQHPTDTNRLGGHSPRPGGLVGWVVVGRSLGTFDSSDTPPSSAYQRTELYPGRISICRIRRILH